MADPPSSRGDAEEAHGPAMAPPCPASVLRPRLQAQDVMRAARPHWFDRADAAYGIILALLAEFSSDFYEEQLRGWLDWMWMQRHYVIWFLRDWVSHLASQGYAPDQILQSVLQLLEAMRQ